MADNVQITAGSGTTIATEEMSGVHWQKVITLAGNSAIASAAATVTDNPEVALPTSALADRKRLLIQNRSTTHAIYVGPSGVATTTGIEVLPGGILELELGPGVTAYGIAESGGSCNVRIFEIA